MSNEYDGTLDELAIYGRAPDDMEIAELWVAGHEGKCKAGNSPRGPGQICFGPQ